MEICLANKFLLVHQKMMWLCEQQTSNSWKQWLAFIVFRLLALRCKYIFIYENYYIQWLLLLFLVTFSASLSGSDGFVRFDSDGNSGYFQFFYAIWKGLYSFFRNLNLGGFYKQINA